MKDRITFKITQSHINRGKRGSRESCPVALALKDIYPLAHVRSTETFIWKGKGSIVDTYVNSKGLSEFIHAFDMCEGEVFPGEFYIFT